ncbi:hypothetical protein AK973_5019 [Pseudomonas brassicacearum]|jgi:hypothetical protein|nr:hypothetical protein AK973_5019 [Pseudomonas brassicacearum]EIK57403.1 hypothetical protein PflQ8_4648 [Pseudomonas fluorescens Q8r1-96]
MLFWSLRKVARRHEANDSQDVFLNTALIVPSQRRLAAVAVESSHELSVGKP